MNSPVNVSQETIELIERCEADAVENIFINCATHLADEVPIGVMRVCGGVGGWVASTDALEWNRVAGAGISERFDAEALHSIRAFFTDGGIRRFVLPIAPSPYADDESALFRNHGLRLHNHLAKLMRHTGSVPEGETDLTVEALEPQHSDEFATALSSAFGWPTILGKMIACTVGSEAWRHYVARDGDRVVSVGTIFFGDGCAWLGFAETLESHRGRGADTSITAARIRDAAERGIPVLTVETERPTADHPVPAFEQGLRTGFSLAYERPNYVWQAA